MNEFAALVRFAHLTAAIMLAGGFGFELFVAPPRVARLALRRQHLGCVATLFVTLLAILWLQAANVGAPSGFSVNAVFPLVTETQFGKVWLARLFLLIVIGFLILRRATNVALGFAFSAALLAISALAGHAAAADGMTLALQLAADALHLLAGGIWLGGLIPLARLLRQCHRDGDNNGLALARTATRRFSKLALASVLMLIVTGIYNAWNLVGGFAPLLGTTYGQLLLVKLALLLPLLIFGAINLIRLKPMVAAADDRAIVALKSLARNVVIEVLLGVAILLLVGHMGITPPARHVQPGWPLPFRWDWTVLEKSPKAFAEAQRGAIWAAVGAFALLGALFHRGRRRLAIPISLGALIYAANLVHQTISIDAYPDTYKRPAIAYQAISIANGAALFQDSGCAGCHGPGGRGDGPVAVELTPPPPDLTARHANAHTAGDLFWWLSHGVKPTSAMPGFSQSLSEEERWDLINYMRALASGQRAKNLAPVIDAEPTLVAPDFAYQTNDGAAKNLKDQRGGKLVLLVMLNLQDANERLRELGAVAARLKSVDVEIVVVPHLVDRQFVGKQLPGLIVSEGLREIAETYKLFAASFNYDTPRAPTPHAEFLIDKQGYIRARWLPAENTGWRKFDLLMQQIEILRKAKPSAPAPDEHVH